MREMLLRELKRAAILDDDGDDDDERTSAAAAANVFDIQFIYRAAHSSKTQEIIQG